MTIMSRSLKKNGQSSLLLHQLILGAVYLPPGNGKFLLVSDKDIAIINQNTYSFEGLNFNTVIRFFAYHIPNNSYSFDVHHTKRKASCSCLTFHLHPRHKSKTPRLSYSPVKVLLMLYPHYV